MRTPALTFLLLLAITNAKADQIFVRPIAQKDIDAMVHHVPTDDSARFAQLKQTYKDVSCKSNDIREQRFGSRSNLICTLPGSSLDTILVVAHYERRDAGTSAVDNWSGAIMLPFLYYALTASPRQHTFVFAEFDGEAGGKAYMHSLTPAQLHSLKAVIAVDALGLGPAAFYLRPTGEQPTGAEITLESMLFEIARANGGQTPAEEIPGGWFKVDDTKQFRYKNIPTILIHSVSWQWHSIPGTEKDTADAIDGSRYYETYRLLSYYIADLDSMKAISPKDAPSPSSHGRRH